MPPAPPEMTWHFDPMALWVEDGESLSGWSILGAALALGAVAMFALVLVRRVLRRLRKTL